ncbi:sugar phosphate isomerase/epimerase family protein [Bacillus suaedae]|uniref:Sugar phosphate isomerase/epimerase n=1 Tax=Halalkalibacter suaedae TaxID=2822140 RepID=A0A940WQ46_9BACI|nr:sugar phosphate isomerase/epimerase [Bacillus suaedae]MBP3950281.1 sugar phosphate isomerase/epimerase [Bacillus suaedae]
MSSTPIAVQMYTLREESKVDFVGTLKKVAELGFDGVEFAGFEGRTAEEVKALLDEFGLKAASSHISLERLKDNLDEVIADQKTIGSKFIVCPFLAPDQRSEEDYYSHIDFLEKAGKRIKEEGLTLCYHNHEFELELLSDGRKALEAIFDDTSAELVQTELDIYWLTKAGENPFEWIKRYKGRTPLIHLKDMTTDEEQFFAELGTGGIDIEGILQLGEEAGVEWWIVEQDVSRLSPLESIEISMNYLKNLKKR